MRRKTKQLHKYPVTYKGKVYEVRFNDVWCNGISIFEVTKNIFGKNKYRYVYNVSSRLMDIELEDLGIPQDSPTRYIEMTKIIFRLWQIEEYNTIWRIEKHKKEQVAKQIQHQTLADWDGVIEEV